jgi:hypothetical protein
MKFARLKDHQLSVFAGSAILGLTNNPYFPNLPVSLADLSAANDAYYDAYVKSMGKGTIPTAVKNAARCELISVLRDEAHYIQSVAKNNLTALLSSGFTAIDRNTAQSRLPKPFIKAVLNQSSGELWLRLKRVPNARNYQVQLKVGDGEWTDAGIYSKARKIVLTGLMPGTVYMVQVRALGGSTGYSDWSMAATKMAT